MARQTDLNYQKILIVDFGSQLTQLIARRLREQGFYAQIHPFQLVNKAYLDAYQPFGIILAGGPASVLDENPALPNTAIFDYGVPIMGICYGQQSIAHCLGGEVIQGKSREFGFAHINIIKDCPLFDGIWQVGQSYQVWMSHGDKVGQIPQGFENFAKSEGAEFAIFGSEKRNIYGIMFHPEASHTENGAKLIANFAQKICKIHPKWNMAEFSENAITEIRQQVGNARVISGLSGGVDSAVASVLVHKAIGEQLTCIFIDNGLLRNNEAMQVVELFRNHYNIQLIHRDASEIFLAALQGISDPEQKRKIIGKLFIDIFTEEANKIGGADFLVQGTLYPDVIESVSFVGGPSVTIKSHHNVGGLPEKMQLKLVEPLRELFKDEVRKLGLTLGLPPEMINRHPFPGPGLAIRVLGDITPDKCQILRACDEIYLSEIRKNGYYDKIWQAFAVLLPVRTVGVMGDGRSYEYIISLRAVTSVDGMTAEAYVFPGEFLQQLATKIINQVRGVNRVVYDYTSKPPATIEYE